MGINPTASKIMIIRHAEKPLPGGPSRGVTEDGVEDPESLTVRGWQRAGALASLFAPPAGRPPATALAPPQTIFASENAPDKGSQRPLQTITPLARLLQVTPLTFHKDKLEKVAKAAQASLGTVLISWQHEDIPAIAQFLPGDQNAIQKEWPGDRFDVIWVFDLDSSLNSYVFSQVPQQLLDGDAPTSIS